MTIINTESVLKKMKTLFLSLKLKKKKGCIMFAVKIFVW